MIGGAAHLWDCIPSKALIATGGELAELQRAHTMGIAAEGHLDIDALRERVQSIESRVQQSIEGLLASQGVRMIRGTGRLTGPRCVVATTDAGEEEIEADFVLVSTGSRPRVPDFAPVDGDRVLTTRDAYPPPVIPEHAIVIGSGVTGVEFTHLFQSLGSQVTLLVSRQQVLPIKDPEVAAVLEESFLDVGVKLLKGARADVDHARRRRRARALRRRSRDRPARTCCSRSGRSRTPRGSGSRPSASRSTSAAASG